MKVIKLDFEKIDGNNNFLQMTCEVVDKSFSWVISNQVMPCCNDVDPGPIDAEAIPLPLFENWAEFGKNPDGRSMMIPDSIDLNGHESAHGEIRLFGTINLIESLERNDFQVGDKGLKAFLQLLLTTKYIRSACDFDTDLMNAATKELQTWDQDSIFRFVQEVIGRKGTVSVADVAHVVHVITGKEIDIEEQNFNIMKVAQVLPTHGAAANKPDEFFSAAFPGEIMEYDIVKDLIVDVDGAFYFGRGAKHPTSWGINGPGAVLWRAAIQRTKDAVKVDWAPVAGTLFDRAIESKKLMFGDKVDDDIPFQMDIKDCHILDSGMYPTSPRDFNTGIRYMAVNQNLPIMKTTLVSTDLKNLASEIGRFPISRLPSDYNVDDIRDEIVRIYNNELPTIDRKIDTRHFMVFNSLADLGRSEEECQSLLDDESHKERIDTQTMPGAPQNIRGIIMHAWVLMHMMTDSLCYQAAANDDFTVDSAIEYCLDIVLKKKSTVNTFLVGCPYSQTFGRRRLSTREVVNLDRGLNFDSF